MVRMRMFCIVHHKQHQPVNYQGNVSMRRLLCFDSFSFLVAIIVFATYSVPANSAEERAKPSRDQQMKQRGKFKERILKHDKNKDGKITKAEWGGPEKFFSRLDKNSDGTITEEELTFGRSGKGRGKGKGKSGEKLTDVIGNESMSKRMAKYTAFPEAKPAPGDMAPLFELKDINGKTVSLAELLKTKPVIIETGSCTCPIFRRRHPKVEAFRKEYADKVHFVVLYGREAHAGSGKFEDIQPPKTIEQRIKLAKKIAKEISINAPVAVDDINNKVTLSYGSLPNCGYIIGQDGRVFFKMPWIHEGYLDEPLKKLLSMKGQGGEHPPSFETGATRPTQGRQSKNNRKKSPNKNNNTKNKTTTEFKNAPVKIPQGSKLKIVWASGVLSDAIKIAAKAKVPVLLKFHFDGCPLCIAMDKGPLVDTKVVALSRKFVGVKVDIVTDAGQKTGDNYKVIGTPAFVILSPDGSELSRHLGPADAKTMQQFLQDALQNNLKQQKK